MSVNGANPAGTGLRTAKVVSVTVPCEPVYLGIIRLTASSAATIASMDIDDVDDVRIASDELSYLLMSAQAEGEDLTITFEMSGSRLIISGERKGWPEGGVLPGASELMVKILSKVIEDFEITAHGGAVSFRAVKEIPTGSGATGAVTTPQ